MSGHGVGDLRGEGWEVGGGTGDRGGETPAWHCRARSGEGGFAGGVAAGRAFALGRGGPGRNT